MKPTLMFLPGLMCDRDVWQEQITAFAGDYAMRLVNYDLASSLASMARCVLEQAPEGPLAIIGHSMGGRVALEVYRQSPMRVSHLALLNTGAQAVAKGEAGEQEREGREALLEQARSEGMKAMARAWATPMVHPDHLNTPVFESVVDMIAHSTPSIFEAQIQALLTRPDASDVLQSIQVPSLFLTGVEDHWSSPAQHVAMADQVANAQLEVLENCGHMSPMEAPEQVTQALKALLSQS